MIPSLTVLLAVILVVTSVALSIKRIPEGQVYTLKRLGKPAGILPAGTHLVIPFLETIAHKISIAGHTLAVDERANAPADAAALRGRVWWQVLDPERADAVIDRADDMIRLGLRDAVAHAYHDATTRTTQDAHARNQCIKQTLNGRLRERGVLVTRVELDSAA